MSYRLKLNEGIQPGLRRVLAEQCERAEAYLTDVTDPVVAIHEARKCFKRMRAALRLARGAIDNERWDAENAAVRDIARSLSTARDRDVILDTLKRLEEDAPRALGRALHALRKHLTAAAFHDGETADRDALVLAAAKAMPRLRKQLGAIPVGGATADVIEAGLDHAHARGQKSLAAYRENAEVEALHDLRKAVQVHWRQMSMLAAAWPAVMKARASEAREISALIGDALDLARLAEVAEAAAGNGLTPPHTALIVRAAAKRRDAAETEGVARAARLFAVKPSRFAAEIAGYWTVAADQKAGVPPPRVGNSS